jgi:type I restriction enzyme S subunit
MEKQKNIPELRFPEFDREWEGKKIIDFAPLQRGFDLPVDKIKVGEYPVVFSNGILKIS